MNKRSDGYTKKIFIKILFVALLFQFAIPALAQKDISIEETTDLMLTATVEAPPFYAADPKTGIAAQAEAGVVPENAVLRAEAVRSEDEKISFVKDVANKVSPKYWSFSIALEIDGIKIQPAGKMKITIPLPVEFNKNKIALYRIKSDETMERVTFIMDKNSENIVFESQELTVFALVDLSANTVSKNDAGDVKTGDMPAPWAMPAFVVSAAGLLLLKKKRMTRSKAV